MACPSRFQMRVRSRAPSPTCLPSRRAANTSTAARISFHWAVCCTRPRRAGGHFGRRQFHRHDVRNPGDGSQAPQRFETRLAQGFRSNRAASAGEEKGKAFWISGGTGNCASPIANLAVDPADRQASACSAAVAIVLVAAVATWNYRRESRLRWARENVTSIPQFARDQKFFEAYDLAHEVGKVLPDDPILREWLPFVTEDFSISTDPPGAEISLRRFQRDESGSFYPPERIGTSPIQNRQIARGDYLLMIEKQGYVPILRTVSNAFQRVERGLWIKGAARKAELLRLPKGRFEMVVDSHAPIDIKIKLVSQAAAPARMVRVPGGPYTLVGVDRPNDHVVQLSDYFIDQFEVTNREFKEFVDAGGYERKEYWKQPFLRDDAPLTWEAAMKLLVDQTGRPGPRDWSEQHPPSGKEDHPVTDITWYESAAFAEFRGKSLPTVFQWEKAARDGQSTVYWGSVMPWGMVGLNPNMEHRANLNSLGTAPVSSFEFGTSPYGCYHMAGNVAEWCKNASPNGFTTTGGSWHDGPHMFYGFGQFPGFYSASTLGFRCVLNLPGATGDQGGIAIEDTEEVPQLKPVSEDVYRIMRSHYEYDHLPLEEEIVEDVSTTDWRRLKITYVGGRASGADGSAPGSNRGAGLSLAATSCRAATTGCQLQAGRSFLFRAKSPAGNRSRLRTNSRFGAVPCS